MQEGSTLHIGDGPFAVESFNQSICNRASFRVVAEPLQIGCAVLLAECLWLSVLGQNVLDSASAALPRYLKRV